MTTNKVWYVTGASKGLGLALVKKLLQAGYAVAATSRSKNNLIAAVGDFDANNFLPLAVDLTSETSITQSVQETQAFFGKIDVVVNNAGYGIGGAVEELSAAEIQQSFEVNVFAPIRVMQAVMPYFRAQKSGHIINISSIAGFSAAAGWSMYAATKFALTGLTEVTADDVQELGIKATVVAPGAFRTEFLTDDSLVFAEQQLDDYATIRRSHEKYRTMNGNQQGDPEKAAEALIALAENPNPPVRLFLGSDAYRRAQAKVNALAQELEENKAVTFSTDF
ncbi:SDR family NAD(P)-dependent oxidoreductase [Adhaeribacter swui]|uniref:SDR family NAD(P)-dependent oxidoreductase n=1 Tax=Adhaeribacter swui TaxID=2086471 RepID=A0A7G7G6Q0_9BACT|nr:SDR family NAD(P)-dependent oxidoreductase [Adhaeribacter swui]QNF32834.1 SDR family NAD(P)-dependent oxidoreductase [Adhaeribacter swui]